MGDYGTTFGFVGDKAGLMDECGFLEVFFWDLVDDGDGYVCLAVFKNLEGKRRTSEILLLGVNLMLGPIVEASKSSFVLSLFVIDDIV